MNNCIKLGALVIMVLPYTANAAQKEPQSLSMGFYQTNVAFDWSIDNSHAGQLEKASEIIWKTKAIGLELNYDTKWSNHKVYFAMSGKNHGTMTDEDWHSFGGNIEKWSNTNSSADFFQIGYQNNAVHTRWEHALFMDKIDLNFSFGLGYEQFDAFGLTNRFNDAEIFPESVKTMSNKMLTLHSGVGVDFEKQFGQLTVGFAQNLGLDARLSLDYHHLRDDLKDVSFIIFSPYLSSESKLYASYNFGDGYILSSGASYSYSFAIMDKLLVRPLHGEMGYTGLNNSTREDVKLFITLSKKFG